MKVDLVSINLINCTYMAKLKTGRHTSAIKALRQSEKSAAKNRGVKARIKLAVKELDSCITKQDIEAAQKVLPKIYSLLDKASKKGVIHAKAASRKKSRLSTRAKKVVKQPSVK
ncbi:MAG: 30S ribosomal protein S20 [Elusimicrobiales bacterium]|nr:30S ribosomal protein S20 [Elusimicrobiales bacterium]